MKTVFVVLGTLINFVNADTFSDFEKEYEKSYEDDYEIEDAKQSYDMNCAFIAIINSRSGQRYKLGLNEFADKGFDKFKEESLGAKSPSSSSDRGNKVTFSSNSNSNIQLIQAEGGIGNYTPVTAPPAVDYRNYSLAILNQKNCGSCWAFTALGVLESRMTILNPLYNTVLSEQYLLDCDTRDYACNGGWPMNALNWIFQSGGNSVPAMTSYQYFGFKTKCRTVTKIPMNIIATIQNYTAGNEGTMKQIVANVGPVAVVVSVTSFFQLYKTGIFYDATCNSNCGSVNHAVIIVGYGTDPVTNLDYWIVKNS
ncbi:unnamed protein product [Chironomus riparius]|uniref:Uncharacterized protein n=1 Tax=Chironomus riparius TaxID=315576 RepID=A0A9N9WW88_9DIPT|nr:unnamed protein product [Chironomus riparius]